MHAGWKKASSKRRYAHFIPALTAGMDKLNNYYQRSAASDAHIMAMGNFFYILLHLLTNLSTTTQSSTRRRRWDTSWSTGQQSLLKTLKTLFVYMWVLCFTPPPPSCAPLMWTNRPKFIQRFEELNKKPQTQATHIYKTRPSSKPGHQNVYNTDTETDDDDCQQVVNADNSWIEEWKLYLNTHEVVPDDIGIVHWWGVCLFLFYFLASFCSQYVR